MSLIDKLVSIIQKDQTKIEGIISDVNRETQTITLRDVYIIGTEDRPVATYVPMLDQQFAQMSIQKSIIDKMVQVSIRTEKKDLKYPPSHAPKPVDTTTQSNTNNSTTTNDDNNNTNAKSDDNNNNNTTQDNGDAFNTRALEINRDPTNATPTYDKNSSFFDQTNINARRQTYSDVATFGKPLSYRPRQQGGNPRGYNNNNNNNNYNNRPNSNWNNNNNNQGNWNNNNNNRGWNNNNGGGYRNTTNDGNNNYGGNRNNNGVNFRSNYKNDAGNTNNTNNNSKGGFRNSGNE